MKLTLVVLPVLLAGCGSDGGIEWQVPCGGSQFNDGESVATYLFEYEWDGEGHLLSEVATDLAGTPVTTFTQEWQGDIVVLAEFDGPGFAYTSTATVAGGHIATIDYSDETGVEYHEDWTWTGGQLDRIDRDLATGADQVETYADAPSGFTYTVCPVDDPESCDRYTVVGADHRGDFARWTRYDYDTGDDGSIQYRTDRELDRHELVITEDTHAENLQGQLIPTSHLEYDREMDGTALELSFEQFGTAPSSYIIEYAFECGEARVSPPPMAPHTAAASGARSPRSPAGW